MPFQFYCPQGHLLEGQESQMGQPSQCPMCGSQFTIPVLGAPPAGAMVQPQQPFPNVAGSPFDGVATGPNFGQIEAAVSPPAEGPIGPPPETTAEAEPQQPETPPEPRILRIPCESCGQELQTPDDMLGQRVMCPYCNHQFDLRYELSVEYQEEQAELRRVREEQLNKFFLTWAIRSAVIVGVLLLGMIGYIVYLSYAK